MIDSVLKQYEIGSDNLEIESLGNAGGFSGSQIWNIRSIDGQQYCLKRWPSQFLDQPRLQWIHKILNFAAANGCNEIVRPIPTNNQDSFVLADEHYWELNKWIPDQRVDHQSITKPQLQSALDVTARFHQATARYFFNFATSDKIQIVHRGLMDIEKSIHAIDSHFDASINQMSADWVFFKSNAVQIASDINQILSPHQSTMLPVQPVIKDLRLEHLFFQGEKVSAIIDFGAMQVDSIICDLSRLLGDAIHANTTEIHDALQQYSQHRPISPVEQELTQPLMMANVLLGITHWMRWIFVEKIQFDSIELAHQRLQCLMDRFKNAAV